jgi:uncharacterized spore protein YtfJ
VTEPSSENDRVHAVGRRIVMELSVTDIIERSREVLTVKRVFGEPIHENGVTVVPAAAVRGGGGGGGGDDPEHQTSGGGGGFGVIANPVGA